LQIYAHAVYELILRKSCIFNIYCFCNQAFSEGGNWPLPFQKVARKSFRLTKTFMHKWKKHVSEKQRNYLRDLSKLGFRIESDQSSMVHKRTTCTFKWVWSEFLYDSVCIFISKTHHYRVKTQQAIFRKHCTTDSQ